MLTFLQLQKPRYAPLNPLHLGGGLIAALGAALLLIPGMGAWSMWLDEINMVVWARDLNPLDPATFALRQGHPPLYLLLLSGWQRLAGFSDVSMRLLSVLPILLAAVLIYRTVLDLTRQPLTALGCCLLLAALPYTIYYAHEAHNYGLFMGLSAAAIFFYQRWWRHHRQRDLVIGLCGSILLLIYTHYFSLFLVLALNVYALWLLYTKRRRQWFEWIGWQVLVGVGYLPWIGVVVGAVINVLNRPTIPGMAGRGAVTGQRASFQSILDTIRVMLSGQEWLYALLLIAGIGSAIWLYRRDRRAGQRASVAILLGLVIIIAGLAFGMGFNFFLRSFLHRRMIFLIPGLVLTVAGCIAVLPAWPRRFAIAALLVASLMGGVVSDLPGDWMFRQAVESIRPQLKPGDMVYIHFETNSNEQKPLAFYISTLLPPDTATFSYVDQDFSDPAKTEQFANQVFAPHVLTHDRFWVISSTIDDFGPLSLDWIGQIKDRGYKEIKTAHIGWLLVTLYEARRVNLWPVPTPGMFSVSESVILPAQFGDMFELERAIIGDSPVRPGDSIPIWLNWKVLVAPDKDYAVFIHLRKEDQPPVAQVDSDPYFWDVLIPTSLWAVGGLVPDQHTLVIGPDVVPGEYDLVIGFYDRDTLVRLPVRSRIGTISDGLKLAQIVVSP